MLRPDKLSDLELFLLAENDKFSPFISHVIRDELKRRGLDSFTSGTKNEISKPKDIPEASLANLEKCFIFISPLFLIVTKIYFPLLIVGHCILANRHVSKASLKKRDKHWRYFKITYLAYFIGILIYCLWDRLTNPTV